LYYEKGTCALASHIALEEAGAEYSTMRVNFGAGEQRSPEYLAVNPKGRVPSLVTERGILTETPAMLAFIAQSFPKAGLAPLDDPFRFAEVQAFNSYLCSTVHVAHAHRLRESYTICDPYLFTIARWLEGDGVDPARFPKVKAHRDRISERPAVRKVVADEKA
jgi:glutathione S-transferase